MGQETQFQTPQGLEGRDITLVSGESATITFHKAVYWDRGGVSVALIPGAAASVAYEQSLTGDSDDWTPDRESPFTEPSQIRETVRISRLRITTTGGPARATLLSPAPVLIEIA